MSKPPKATDAPENLMGDQPPSDVELILGKFAVDIWALNPQ
jgi:hypothetical protein